MATHATTDADDSTDTTDEIDYPENFIPKFDEPLFGPRLDADAAVDVKTYAYLKTPHGTLTLSKIDLFDITQGLVVLKRHHHEHDREFSAGEAWRLRSEIMFARDGPDSDSEDE
jgi:hypothetical protein